MADYKCPFCNSKELRLKTPYLKVDYGTPGNPGTGKPTQQFTYCCRKQAQNVRYQEAHRNPFTGEKPDLNKLSKL